MSNQSPYHVISITAAQKRNMSALFGPCGPDEYHLIDRAVKQLTKDGSRISFAYVNETDNPDEITVFRKTSG